MPTERKPLSESEWLFYRAIATPSIFTEFTRPPKKGKPFRLWRKQIREMAREERRKKRVQARDLGKSVTASDEFKDHCILWTDGQGGIALFGSRQESNLQPLFETELVIPFLNNPFLKLFIPNPDTAINRKTWEIRLANGVTIKGRIQGKDGAGFNCFAGSTRILTRSGTKAISDLAGTIPTILTRDPFSDAPAYWTEAPVTNNGQQKLWRLALRRHGQRKELMVTSLHRWYIRQRYRPDPSDRNRHALRTREVHTYALRPNDRIVSSYAPTADVGFDPEGIRHGVVFGDGSRERNSSRSAFVDLYGEKDAQLLPWFEDYPQRPKIDKRVSVEIRHVDGLPRAFKEVPSLDQPLDYLKGWLMGYFAADGCVNTNNIPVLVASTREHLEFARDVATLLGYQTKAIVRRYSKGSVIKTTGQVVSPSHSYQLAFAKGVIEPNFFLIRQHRERALPRRQPNIDDWYVESVEETDRVEDVFCAEVPLTSTFTLEDNILTGNTVHPNVAAWFDEVQLLSDAAVKEMLGMLNADLPILCSGVPNGVRSSFAWRIDNDPTYGFAGGRMTRLDDPRMTPEYLDLLKRELGEDSSAYKQQVLGEWGADARMTFDLDRIILDLPVKAGESRSIKPAFYRSIELSAADVVKPDGTARTDVLMTRFAFRGDIPKTDKVWFHADHGQSASPTSLYITFWDLKEHCWRTYHRVLLYGMEAPTQASVVGWLAQQIHAMTGVRPVIGFDTTGQGGGAVMASLQPMGFELMRVNLNENVQDGLRPETDEEYKRRLTKDPFSQPQEKTMVPNLQRMKQVAFPRLAREFYAGKARLVGEDILVKQFGATTDHEGKSGERIYECDFHLDGVPYNHDLSAWEIFGAMLHNLDTREEIKPPDFWVQEMPVAWGSIG